MTIARHETNARMSQAVVFNGVAYFAGQVGSVPDDGVAQQTEQALEKVDRLLTLVHSDRTRLLCAHVWLADIGDFDEMNAAWEAWVPDGSAPARATVEARLAHDHWKVEIMVWAATQ